LLFLWFRQLLPFNLLVAIFRQCYKALAIDVTNKDSS
jgi:hypothetical protein